MSLDPAATPNERLLQAIEDCNVESVRKALDDGADPNLPDGEGGGEPLFDAVLAKNAAIMALLLERGGNPNFITESGGSLYDWARFDYTFDLGEDGLFPRDEQPTKEDRATEEAYLAWLYRMAAKHGFPPPDYLRVMREAGAKTAGELRIEEKI